MVVDEFRAARLEKGWSQEKLAALAGVSRTGVTMIENGERRPTLSFCRRLAKALEINLSSAIASVEGRIT
jgi:transcriptional regulator with XRE-family HTH domain